MAIVQNRSQKKGTRVVDSGPLQYFDGTTWIADGTKIVSKQIFTCLDADHFEVRGNQQTEGDEQLSKFGIRARRIK